MFNNFHLTEDKLLQLADSAHDVQVYPNPLYPPSIYYRFLKLLAGYMQPVVSVELGVCGGGGCLHLALGYKQGVVLGIDNKDHSRFPERFAHIKSVCDNIIFWTMDSVDAALDVKHWLVSHYAKKYKTSRLVDILFIDTIHTYEQTMLEFNAWRPLLSSRAVVLLDDLFRGGMLDAWNEIPGSKVRLDLLHDCGGFGAIWGIPQ